MFNVYNSITGELVEGGFFSRDAAEACAAEWTRETGHNHFVKKAAR